MMKRVAAAFILSLLVACDAPMPPPMPYSLDDFARAFGTQVTRTDASDGSQIEEVRTVALGILRFREKTA